MRSKRKLRQRRIATDGVQEERTLLCYHDLVRTRTDHPEIRKFIDTHLLLFLRDEKTPVIPRKVMRELFEENYGSVLLRDFDSDLANVLMEFLPPSKRNTKYFIRPTSHWWHLEWKDSVRDVAHERIICQHDQNNKDDLIFPKGSQIREKLDMRREGASGASGIEMQAKPIGFECITATALEKTLSQNESHGIRTCRESDSKKKALPIEDHLGNVKPMKRIPRENLTEAIFEKYILENREPIIVEFSDQHLQSEIWSIDWLMKQRQNCTVRSQRVKMDDESQFRVSSEEEMPLPTFLQSQFEKSSKNPNKISYAKDFSFSEHPSFDAWMASLSELIPAFLLPEGPSDMMDYLYREEPERRPRLWMAYIGSEGTRTPLHVDRIASIAFNLHVIGKGTKEWWFIRYDQLDQLQHHIVELGGDFWNDSFWMAPAELESLGLPMWQCQQKRGDLVIVPPAVPHTVLNRGELSCAIAADVLHYKTVRESWNREKVNYQIQRNSPFYFRKVIEHALRVELEERKNTSLLEELISIFAEILEEEGKVETHEEIREGERTCNACGMDIYNRVYTCPKKRCDFDLCPLCYAKGHIHQHSLSCQASVPLCQLHRLLERHVLVSKESKKRRKRRS
eukprot:TRINITY_DN2816_c0_g1_i9.p1 TRINITY_DN2816_c0_g1~~TRINITY_DN2816_c0_g1_i9.p1  ORF type:complete len:624 (-),score=117.75 TRINITY_DN2816_c0_g1_i9:68-1939(-)